MATIGLERARARRGQKSIAPLPLRNGEHLARAEFERRWDANPALQSADHAAFLRKLRAK